MERKRLKITLSVLDAVRNRFPETNEFIDSTLKEECEKERITYDEVIFYKFKSKQGQVFKRFKEEEKFAKLVSELGIHKNTIVFRINVFELYKKHNKLMKSSMGLGFFKNYHKNIKAICEQYEKGFQC